jgi:uncharacterized protein with ParB-like and HNH nuclease domain
MSGHLEKNTHLITGAAKTVRELLINRYTIDSYQREYKWQPKHVFELLDDLSSKFLDEFDSEHDRQEVANYGHYFLGSIIISCKNNQNFIIDGQQRLTTLTLLIIYLANRQKDLTEDSKVDIKNFIFSTQYGKKSFNIDVPERTLCLEKLYQGETFEPAPNEPEAIRNIAARYKDIEQNFPNEITDQVLPYFIDWLIGNVDLVEITAYSDDDAYTIFETMNDRGLSLSPIDMLKGFLVANIKDEDKKALANNLWKSRTNALLELSKEEDSDAIKAWLRSQYAKSIRERKKGASPGDFDRLGTQFHRWVRENDREIGLKKSDDFFNYVERDFQFYTQQYLRLRQAAQEVVPGLEVIYYNAKLEFTLQYPLLLAPLSPDDKEDTIRTKLRVVATYIDIMLARRLWNFHSIAYSNMQYAMFLVMKEIRRKPVSELVSILSKKLTTETESFADNPRLRLHQQNNYAVHWLLARLTDFVELSSGLPTHFKEYMAEGKERYEIEHIWANHPEWHEDEFAHAADFAEYRNRIGGLLLLPKQFNGSYGDLPYKDKLPYYLKGNILVQSLHKDAYERNPEFLRFREREILPFEPHVDFKKADIDKRQVLYNRLAEILWSPDRIAKEGASYNLP